MFAPKKILVPIDFSEGSKKALKFATSLAAPFDAQVEVVHVWQPPAFLSAELVVLDPEANGVSLEDWVEAEAGRALASFLEEAKEEGGTLLPSRLVRGEPTEVIPKLAKDEGVDLLVMGTHGRTGVARMLAGSVTEHTVRVAGCPVLTVPPDRD